MSKRVFIVHGWDGHPEEGWLPWLKRALEARGFFATALAMPNPRRPIIDEWIAAIRKAVGAADRDTFLVGHSIGAQAILRYLESLSADQRIGGAVFVAGWVTLTSAAYEQEGDEETAQPWLKTPINWEKVKSRASGFTAIFSDDDPFVPLADVEIFQQKLDADIIIEHGKGHFSGSDGVIELPSALDAVFKHAEIR